MSIKKLFLQIPFLIFASSSIYAKEIKYVINTQNVDNGANQEQSTTSNKEAEKAFQADTENDMDDYKLNIGDIVRITIFDEENLSGEYQIDSKGRINMPLIGSIATKDKVAKQLGDDIRKKYQDGYLTNPIVNVEVTSVKPFFIIGEVNNPGSFQYKNNMSVIDAVATAGGYTYRANKNKIYITRGGNKEKAKVRVGEMNEVLPGDVIIIKERFF
jgi:polysaccharide export outer membrane protein